MNQHTVTSSSENATVADALLQTISSSTYMQALGTNPSDGNDLRGGHFYTGGSDRTTEGQFKWMTGPEAGSNITYANWFSVPGYQAEPYSYGNDEDALVIDSGTSTTPLWRGTWWDVRDGSAGSAWTMAEVTKGFIVEYGGLPQSFVITPNSSVVNEGSSVTFSVYTTNAEWGSSIPYTITGISQADLASGSLTGSIVVNPNGVDGIASLTVNLADDDLTEGTENISLVIGNASATVPLIDTSRTPTYVPGSQQNRQYTWDGTNTILTGTSSIDTLNLNKSYSEYSVIKIDGSWRITDLKSGSVATLNKFDRLIFNNTNVALDNDISALNAIKFISAIIGPNAVLNKNLLGTGIAIFDKGTYSKEQVAQIALKAVLGSNPSNESVVNLLYKNLVGYPPDSFTESYYSDLISKNTYSQESLAIMASNHPLNFANIDLTGFSKTGLEYTSAIF